MRSSAKSQIVGNTTGQMTQFHYQINCKEKKEEWKEGDEGGPYRLKDVFRVIHTFMFAAALFTTAKRCRQHKCPPMDA